MLSPSRTAMQRKPSHLGSIATWTSGNCSRASLPSGPLRSSSSNAHDPLLLRRAISCVCEVLRPASHGVAALGETSRHRDADRLFLPGPLSSHSNRPADRGKRQQDDGRPQYSEAAIASDRAAVAVPVAWRPRSRLRQPRQSQSSALIEFAGDEQLGAGGVSLVERCRSKVACAARGARVAQIGAAATSSLQARQPPPPPPSIFSDAYYPPTQPCR